MSGLKEDYIKYENKIKANRTENGSRCSIEIECFENRITVKATTIVGSFNDVRNYYTLIPCVGLIEIWRFKEPSVRLSKNEIKLLKNCLHLSDNKIVDVA
jgi:hypothetical protein